MNAIVFVIFFALILVVGWIFFDDNDWNGGEKKK